MSTPRRWTATSRIARRTPSERQAAADRLGLLTPVLKGVLTDMGFDNAVKAQQVFGGHGYIVESGMEQFVRDVANRHDLRRRQRYAGDRSRGPQAAARRRPRHYGLLQGGGDFVAAESRTRRRCAPFSEPLKKALDDLQKATLWFMQNAMAKPDNAGAASNDYMHLFGRVALG